MLKKRTLVLSIFFVTLIYFNQEAFAFHKKNMLPQGKSVDWKPGEETVKDAKNRIKSEYCGYKAKEYTLKEPISEMTVDPNTGEETSTKSEIETKKIRINGYHATKHRKVKSPLKPNLNKLFLKI